MTRALVLTGAILLAAGLAGCGKVGQLERPGPMFGANRDAPADADKRKQDPSRPVETIDPRDRSANTDPSRTVPIPGTGPTATDVAPPGVLPDPYARPR